MLKSTRTLLIAAAAAATMALPGIAQAGMHRDDCLHKVFHRVDRAVTHVAKDVDRTLTRVATRVDRGVHRVFKWCARK